MAAAAASSNPRLGDPRLGNLVQVLNPVPPAPAVQDGSEEPNCAAQGCAADSLEATQCRRCQRTFSTAADLARLDVLPDVVLIGFPFSEGTVRNGGRDGGFDGPRFIRRLYPGMGSLQNAEYGVDLSKTLRVADWGDIPSYDSLETSHAKLRQDVAAIIRAGCIPFVLGGSNDQSYSNAAALMDVLGHGRVGVVNIDAHLDVRPLLQPGNRLHSGSPFRLLLEDARFQADGGRFFEFAIQGHQCGAEHAGWAESKGAELVWLTRDLRKPGVDPAGRFAELLPARDSFFVSFDLDAVSAAHASAVSCPGNIGLSADEALQICYQAGLAPNVRLFDLSEFNPRVGDAYVTGRLVVAMFYHFLVGVAQRKAKVAEVVAAPAQSAENQA